ncbi:DUF5984 family protein [Streptomyces sp. NPDC059209]|uniref:DUF5984 family protein n=1 Tax=Streptomyces sp. NPDC059209 TaxID=3346769 RepID=UPI003693E633
MLHALPAALEPVPQDLLPFIAGDHSTWLRTDSPDTGSAADWYGKHGLDTGYLQSAPHIRWWRSVGGVSGADLMTVTWTHAEDVDDGRGTLPTTDFVAAVSNLHRDLFAAMDVRVTTLEATGPPPSVEIDLSHLRHEHQDRATWLRRALDRACDTDWTAVRGARALAPVLAP